MARLLLSVTVAVLCAASTLTAQTLSQGERDRAMSELHATRKAFVDLVSSVSPEQFKFKPAPDVWSIAEVAEHVALTEPFLAKLATGALAKPADPEQLKLNLGKDQSILTAVADRSFKANAPAPLVPKTTFASREALLAAFNNARNANINYLRDTSDPLRAHMLDAPGLPMDCYQVYLMIAAHTQRHISQMKAVQANPAYPAM
jgi:hypothetical protein